MANKRTKTSAEAGDLTDLGGGAWFYSDSVKEHFFRPKNYLTSEPGAKEFDAVGMVGGSACGDMMKMWIKVDPETGRIKKCGWRTFGCAPAIAATSMLSEMITEKGGLTLDKAVAITPRDIMERLGGLPLRKVHCSVLGDQALRKAIKDYRRK